MRLAFPLAVVAAVLLAGCSGNEPATPAAPAQSGAFAPVAQILERRCIGCHGAGGKKGFDFRSYDSLMAGGRPGPAVNPGDGPGSLIVRAVKGEGVRRMPPAGPPLTPEEIATIERWITDGAKK